MTSHSGSTDISWMTKDKSLGFAIQLRGFASKKKFKKSELTMEVGGWVQVSLGIFVCGKASQHSPKPVRIFWSSIPCVFCLYICTLLKVVSHYDLSVLPKSVMG